jgi:phosphatidylserine decarboxylase
MLPDYLRVLPQYFLPKHLLSRLMYFLTRWRWPAWKNWQIRWFIRRYQVDMSSAVQSDAHAHPDFNSFFTRALRPEARPVVSRTNDIACPVDGSVSQAGIVHAGQIFQAKGHNYSLQQLLGGQLCAAPFQGGHFATVYLAPGDYHRIHMPLRGHLRKMVYVPGQLFSVNTRTTRVVRGLFARNERVISVFDTEAGPMAIVLVGALFVASIETVWTGAVTPPRGKKIHTWNYGAEQSVSLERGQEMGRFNMGSTVIILFSAGRMTWDDSIQPHTTVRMGQLLGKRTLK